MHRKLTAHGCLMSWSLSNPRAISQLLNPQSEKGPPREKKEATRRRRRRAPSLSARVSARKGASHVDGRGGEPGRQTLSSSPRGERLVCPSVRSVGQTTPWTIPPLSHGILCWLKEAGSSSRKLAQGGLKVARVFDRSLRFVCREIVAGAIVRGKMNFVSLFPFRSSKTRG